MDLEQTRSHIQGNKCVSSRTPVGHLYTALYETTGKPIIEFQTWFEPIHFTKQILSSIYGSNI